MNKFITGAGGGGGGSGGDSSRAAVEDPDSLASKSYAKIVDLLGEGEWEEVCIGGGKGAYFNGVPVQNSDGTYNYSGVTLETRAGTVSQSRMNIAGTTEASFSVGLEMKYNVPVEQIVYGTSTDYLKVIVGVPSLQATNPNTGDITGTSVEYKIEYKSNAGAWVTAPRLDPTTTFTPLTYDEVSYSGYDIYRIGFKVNPARYFIDNVNGGNEVLRPCVYSLQTNTNSGGWITRSSASTSDVVDVSYDYACTSADGVEIRVVVTDSSFVPPGTFIQGSYPAVYELLGGTSDSGDGVQRISGKTTSAYEREHAFRVTGNSPYTVRVTRLTADSTTNYLQNKTTFQSVSVVTEEKFTYPCSVLVGVSVDATQFNSIPTRAYDCKMLRVKVPNNYDPLTRTYTGFWNGGFKVAWTDNPAWCFYDLITNKRYGLGERIPESYVDKAALYQIAQYCDEYVYNGDGGYEPRFTCNLYLNNQHEAYRVVSDMASIFRGISYWASGAIVPVQDSEKQIRYAFNNTNVQDGMFNYQSSDINTRYNAVTVTWNDPNNFYRQATEYVADDDAIAELGFINQSSTVAFGCTSRGQARRAGKWLLYTNTFETDAVSFVSGADGALVMPGDIITISDTLRSLDRRGGRLRDFDTTWVQFDQEFTFVAGTQYSLTVINDSGAVMERAFTYNGTTDTVSVEVEFDAMPAKDSIFIVSDNAVAPATFRVISVAETSDGLYSVSAVTYNPSKYAFIEDGETLTPASSASIYVGAVTDVVSTEILYSDGVSIKSKVRLDWKAPSKSVAYDVYAVAPDGERFESVGQRATSYEITDTLIGDYTVTVVARDVLGHKSQAYVESVTVLGKTAPPVQVAGLEVRSFNGQGIAKWQAHPDLDVVVGGSIVIKHTTKTSGVSWEDGVVVATAPGGSTQVNIPLMVGTYTAKAVDEGGRYSTTFASALSAYAQIEQSNAMAVLTESPSFSGTKTDLTASGGILSLQGPLSGQYAFSSNIDLTNVYTVRVYGDVLGYAAVTSDLIDSRTSLIDDWTMFDGEGVNTAGIRLMVSTTNDDPSSVGATWSAWEEFTVGDYTARGFRFRLDLSVPSADYSVFVTQLGVSVDAVDRVVGDNNITAPSGGYSVVFDGAFAETPAIAISIDGMQNGDYYVFSSKSAGGFSVRFYNASNTAVSRQFDYVAKGYGRKI